MIKTFVLENARGARVGLSALGAGITSIIIPDRRGRMADVTIGYRDPSDYMADGPCAGKTPGRFANRIAAGHFTIGGKEYQLACNNGPNALHGGPTGFHNRIWESEEIPGGVRFSRMSPDGEEGYPGNLRASVEYLWSDDCELTISFEAETDAPTIVNLTNHAYFNLAGHDAGSVLGQSLSMRCSRYLRADNTDIPTGEIADVKGTPMDFTLPRPIGRDILADYENLRTGKGYNHYFLIDGWIPDGQLREAARLADRSSGRTLSVLTTAPGVMLYSGNWLDDSPVGKSGRRYRDHDAVALECQFPPDAPNHPAFPQTTLLPGQVWRMVTVYKFGVSDN